MDSPLPSAGMFDAPHGAVCAALLRYGMDANIRALRERMPGHPSLQCYREIANLLTGDPTALPEDGVDWIARLCKTLRIKPLSAYGISAAHIPNLVDKAAKSSSMKSNAIELTPGELTAVIERAL